MSASPRKLLRRAQDSLQQIDVTLERHPQARTELAATIGAEGMEALARATADVDAMVAAMSPAKPDR